MPRLYTRVTTNKYNTEIKKKYKWKYYLKIRFSWSSTSLPGNNGRPALASSALQHNRVPHDNRFMTTTGRYLAHCWHFVQSSAQSYSTLILTITLTYELKTGRPVSPILRNIHTNFGFSMPFCFKLGASSRWETVGQNLQYTMTFAQ